METVKIEVDLGVISENDPLARKLRGLAPIESGIANTEVTGGPVRHQSKDKQVDDSLASLNEDEPYLILAVQAIYSMLSGVNPVNGTKLQEGAWDQIPAMAKAFSLLLDETGLDSSTLSQIKNKVESFCLTQQDESMKKARWGKASDVLLTEQVASGMTCSQIATFHERERAFIEARVQKLGLHWPVPSGAAGVVSSLQIESPVVDGKVSSEGSVSLKIKAVREFKSPVVEVISDDFFSELARQAREKADLIRKDREKNG